MAVAGAASFFDRLTHLSNDHLLEGAFWTTWCGFNLSDWRKAVKNRQEIDAKPLSAAEKADHVWEATKTLFLKTCSALSGLSMVVCWAAETSLIVIGAALPWVSAGGYWASSIVSSAKSYTVLSELKRGIYLYHEVEESNARGDLAYQQLRNMIHLSMSVCFATWAALSGVHVLYGGARLFEIADSFFYYGALLCCANLGAAILQPKAVTPSKS